MPRSCITIQHHADTQRANHIRQNCGIGTEEKTDNNIIEIQETSKRRGIEYELWSTTSSSRKSTERNHGYGDIGFKRYSGISLIVSGITVMTTMLVSVNERTREIGIKNHRARNGYITEFLIESIVLCLLECGGGFHRRVCFGSRLYCIRVTPVWSMGSVVISILTL